MLLPGQSVPVPKGPIPQLGRGVYAKDGIVRASLLGEPQYDAESAVRSQ